MAHTISPEEYEELGRSYYRRKDYEKAVEAFTNGIDATPLPPISLFDFRAASYHKLANFSLALKDGRSMIRSNKRDIKGYLRTANILEKTNKLEQAIAVYKLGMKNVPIDNKHFKVLQQLHDKFTRQLSPPNAMDPFTILPVELAEMVVSYLSFRHMVNCLRVCKAWKSYLTKRPNLWLDLDFSGARRDVTRAFVRDAVIRADYRVHRATIHRFRHLDVLRNLATACKGLTTLEFLSIGTMSETIIEVAQCAMNLKKVVFHNNLTLDTVAQIMRHRPTLEHAEFRSIYPGNDFTPTWRGPFNNLRALSLIGSSANVIKYSQLHATRNLNLLSLLGQTPNIQSLTVANRVGSAREVMDLSSLPLQKLVLDQVELGVFPQLPSTLTHLTIEPHPSFFHLPMNEDNVSWQNGLRSYLPGLIHISLNHVGGLDGPFLTALLDLRIDESGNRRPISTLQEQIASLRHLSVRNSIVNNRSFFGENGALTSSSRIISRSLQSLDLSYLSIRDEDVESLLSSPEPPTSLAMIDLSSTNVTGYGAKLLIDKIPSLKNLILNGCSKISGRDIINYGASKGINVAMQMGDTLGSGRRVRYG